MAGHDHDQVARLLAELDGATDDHELAELWHRAHEELAGDTEAFTAFLTEAHASGLADRVSAARDRNFAKLVDAVEEDLKRRREAIIPDAFARMRGEVPAGAPDDALSGAESEMTDHEFALFRELFEGLSSRLGPAEEPLPRLRF